MGAKREGKEAVLFVACQQLPETSFPPCVNAAWQECSDRTKWSQRWGWEELVHTEEEKGSVWLK